MPLFDSSTARLNSAKALEARLRNTAERKILVKALLAGSAYSGAQARMESAAPDDDAYLASRLARVRQQIAMMDDRLEEEKDPSSADRIVSAISRLAELERLYAQRPLPGSLRPTAPRRQVAQFTPPADS